MVHRSRILFGLVWGVALAGGAYASGCGGSGEGETTETPSVGGSGGAAGAGGSAAGTAGKGGAAGKSGAAGSGGSGKAGGPLNCDPVKGMDPTTLGDSCCHMNTGSAHCVDDSNVPGNIANQFDTCKAKAGGAGHCLPDDIITAGASYEPAKCKMPVFNVDGVCLSSCIPLIYNDPNVGLLQQATCTKGELCVPCVNPLDNTDTGACNLPAPGCPGLTDGGTAGAGGSGTDGGGVTCPYTGPPILDPTKFPACTPACGGAHCLPATLVPPAQASQLAACTGTDGSAGFCTPDPFIESAGNLVPKTCKSVANVEGRCISQCLPAVIDQLAVLPKDICADDERCAPCYNPFADDPKASTGACNLSCDKPKDPPTVIDCPYTGPAVIDPSVFPACAPACGGAHCVPSALIPMALQSQLQACTGGFCAPDSIVKSGGKALPSTCKSVAGVEGRCLSTCLPQIAGEADLLPKDTCADGEKCAPCYDPTSQNPNLPTGACSTACDKPKDPPMGLTCPYTGPAVVDTSIFSQCMPACGGAHCVPSSLVPSAQAAQLATCTTGDGKSGFCAPDTVVSTGGQGVPKTCTSVAGAEGRCTSTCLPEIASQQDLLPQDTCDATERCAPCYNPFASDPTASTGACDLACDKPAKPPLELTCPYTGPAVVDVSKFPACSPACGGAHCVPAALVPPAQASQLTTCPGGYCAPDTVTASGGKGVPATCTSVAGAEGRCTSICLPAVSGKADLLPQANCATDERCVPCYDPTSTTPTVETGACDLACDKPTKPPVVLMCPYSGPDVIDPSIFGPCNPGTCATAHCVPTSLITDPAQAAQLSACSTKQGGAGYCAPDFIVRAGGDGVAKSCTAFAGTASEGRCLPKCLPAIGAQASQLQQDTCGTDELCAPCYDPFSGVATGACGLTCDKPAKAPFLFPGCCTGTAICVPDAEIPPAQESNVQQSDCPTSGANYKCVPKENLPTPEATQNFCTAGFPFSGQAGICLSRCLNIPLSFAFTQQDCPDADHKCVPCNIPGQGKTPGCP